MDDAARWIRCFRRSADAHARLVCFAHAGGSASAYRSWVDVMPPTLDLLAVQYPGREERYGEPCIDNMDVLCEAAAAALVGHADRPLHLFGHSLGASVAYEVAWRLEQRGIAPQRVIASAHPPPHRQRSSDLHRRGDDALVDDIRRVTDDGATLLDDPDVRDLFLPMIRADYRLIETYSRQRPPVLNSPIDVIRPVDDSEIHPDEARAWQELTHRESHVHELPGGHFYLQADPEEVIRRLFPGW